MFHEGREAWTKKDVNYNNYNTKSRLAEQNRWFFWGYFWLEACLLIHTNFLCRFLPVHPGSRRNGGRKHRPGILGTPSLAHQTSPSRPYRPQVHAREKLRDVWVQKLPAAPVPARTWAPRFPPSLDRMEAGGDLGLGSEPRRLQLASSRFGSSRRRPAFSAAPATHHGGAARNTLNFTA